MSPNTQPRLRNVATTLFLVLSLAQPAPAQEAAANDWRIEAATVAAVAKFTQLIDGEWIERKPRHRASFLEVTSPLTVAGDGSFGPVSLDDVALVDGASGQPVVAELLAVGVARPRCSYVRAPIGAGNETYAKLDAEREIAILRAASGDGPLFLRAHARSLELCMVFELPAAPPPALHLRFAGRSIPLTVVAPSAAEPAPAEPVVKPLPVPASSSLSLPLPPAWRQAIFSPLLWLGLGLGAASLIAGIALQRMWRKHRRATQPPADGRFDTSSALDIPRVGPDHQPTRFAAVEADAGPGQTHFQNAMAALRLGDWRRANQLFGDAIATGLTPTFEAGAWGLRGEAMLNDDDLVGATTCFLRSLSCPGVTSEAALPAATQLGAIYRQLRLKRDAQRMDELKARINPFADDLGPQRVALIARLAKELKHKRRAGLLNRLLP